MHKRPGFWERRRRLKALEKAYRLPRKEKKRRIESIRNTYELSYRERMHRHRKIKKDVKRMYGKNSSGYDSSRKSGLSVTGIIFLLLILIAGSAGVWLVVVPD